MYNLGVETRETNQTSNDSSARWLSLVSTAKSLATGRLSSREVDEMKSKRGKMFVYLRHGSIQATRTEPERKLPDTWMCYAMPGCNDPWISITSVDSASALAEEYGFDGYVLMGIFGKDNKVLNS